MNQTSQILGQLERALESVQFEEAPLLLGELERLRARLWSRMMVPVNGNGKSQSRADEDHWLTAEKAADLLNVNKKWLYRRASNLPFTRRLSRRKLLFSESGLRRWLETRKL
jgi:hypothetical protein